MANKNLIYGVRFNVDSSELKNIKTELATLKANLQEIQKTSAAVMPGSTLAQDFKEASDAAKQLEQILNSSWNSKLNQLDLSKFNTNLTKSFGSMQNLQKSLVKAGDVGTSSFNQLSRSILHTNLELKESSETLSKMAVTMANTVRFGISSSVFNTLTNSLQASYEYVKKLDKSLNDIRIVSGQNADQMERFAKQANAAAQSLGATTLDYTNASLIYYQQGLSDEDVAQRASTTVKMANVLGSSASEVSDYMTAIWNNFYDGSKSLEYYADVITKLGAATASSAEEISTGLEKFAAIADTVGLSYEYATAALTTVTATTRQSAEVVGTAFKTLFARIQDLELGETLDDGTTLGKYSEALEKVGISIMDSNGELKDMDNILDEMGSKWDNLSKAQQVSLAQTVAGTRQYTQLVALMDNWDIFADNLETAANATGALDEQQNIYLDSVEAHLNALTAASEKLYDNLFDEEVIKTFADALTGLLGIANNLVEGLGGGVNTFVYFGSILSNVFNNQIAGAINRQIMNMERLGASTEAVSVKMQLLKEIANKRTLDGKMTASQKALDLEVEYAERILDVRQNLTKEEYNELTAQQSRIGQLQDEIDYLSEYSNIHRTIFGENVVGGPSLNRFKKELKEVQEDIKKIDNESENLIQSLNATQNNNFEFSLVDPEEFIIIQETATKTASQFKNLVDIQTRYAESSELSDEERTKALASVQKLTESYSHAQSIANKLSKENVSQLQDMWKKRKSILKEIELCNEQLADGETSEEDRVIQAQNLQKLKEEESEMALKIASFEEGLVATQEEESNLISSQILLRNELVEKENSLKQGIEGIQAEENGVTEQKRLQLGILEEELDRRLKIKEQEKQISTIISGISTMTSVISAGSGLFDTWFGENELSTWEKLNQTLTVTAATLPVLINGWSNLKALFPTLTAQILGLATAEEASNLIKKQGILLTLKDIAAKGLHVIATQLQVLWQTILNIVTGQWDKVGALAVAAVVAIVAAVGIWIYKMIEASTEEAKLQRQIDHTTESVKKAKEAYDELKESINSYSDAKKSIEDLTEGTVEFYEAIIEANEHAQKLIDTLGLMPGSGYTIDANGLINIDEDVLEEQLQNSMQNVYRAQARNDQAYANMERYNRDKIVEDFQNDVNRKAVKSGSSAIISKEQAEAILQNSQQTNTNLGQLSSLQVAQQRTFNNLNTNQDKLYSAVNQTSENVCSAVDQNAIDISSAITEYLPEYNASTARIENYEKRAAQNNLYGYLDQSQLKKYQGLTQGGQDAVTTIMAREKNANKPSTQYNDDFKFLGMDMWEMAENPKWYNPASWGAWIGNQISGDPISEVKGEYLKKTQGYTEKDGTWYDSSGNPLSKDKVKEAMSDVDMYNAVLAHNSGEYNTEDNYSKYIEPILQQGQKLASDKGLSGSSQSYITEALLGLNAGTATEETFKMLTDEEKKAIAGLSRGQQVTMYSDGTQETTDLLGGMEISSEYNMDQINKWLELSGEVGRSTERIKADLKEYQNTLESYASSLDTSTEALEFFGHAMYNASGEVNDMDKASAELIADQYKFNKAYNAAVETYYNNEEAIKEYSKALKNNEDISHDVADAMGELAGTLEDMGLAMDSETISNHLDDITTLLTGTEEEAEAAYQKLLVLARMDTMTEMFGPEAQNQLAQYGYTYQQLVDGISNTNPGALLSENYANALSQMITDTELTASQIEQLAERLNIEIPMTYQVPEELEMTQKDYTIKASSTLHTYTGEMPNPAYNGKNDVTIPVNYSWIETVEDKTESFLVPDKTAMKVKSESQSLGGKRNFTQSLSNKNSKSGGSEPKKEDKIEGEKDRYHDVNVELELISNNLKKLEKQKDKLFGSDLINNINQQLSVLNNQIETTNEKLKIAQGETSELQTELSSKGVTFNTDGTIANYSQAYDQQLAYVNGIIEKYNSMDAKGQESYQDTLDQAKENWQKFLDDMGRYDELVTSFIPGLEEEVQEAVNQKIELQVEAFNMEMEIRLDLSEAEREWNDFKKRIIDGIEEEDILGNTKARLQDFSTYYNTEGTGSIQAGTGHVNDILAQLAQMDSTGWSDVYGDNRTQALEDLKTYYTQLMSDMTDLQALSDEIHESYMDMMDEAQEKFDEQIEAYETIGSLIEHDMNVISLVYGEESYGALSQFYEKQEENNNKALDFQRQQVDFWRQQMDTLEEGSEEWEKAKENWLSAVDTWNAKVEEAIENLQDKYLNAINLIFQNLNNNITDGLGLEYVSEEWNLINQNADKYLDTINSLYETQALENKYLDAIDQTDNVSAQRQLKKLMDQEITALREKDKLTQYDIERANMKYEIALKQIALEEAQQNKSNMRLRRDSQGNYSYQFVADDEGIADAEQELSDLYNSLYNFDKENYQSNLDEIYSVWEEFQSKMAEAAQINDPEAREARELLLKEQYGELINGIVAENEVIRNNLYDSAFTDLADLYNVDVENFQQMADAEKEILMSDLLPYWDSGVQHMADAFAGEDGFLGVCKDAFAELDQATKDYEDGLIEIQDNAGQSFEEIKEGVDETIISTEELVEDNNELIESYNNELEAIDSVIDELDLLIEKYDKAAEAAKKATEEAYKYWQQENKDAADSAGDNKDSIGKDNENKGTNTNTNTNTPTNTSGNSGSNTNSLGTASNGAPFIDSYTIKNGDTLSGIGARYGVAWRRIYEENKSTIGSNPNLIHAGKTLKIPKYDTGGYTGEWSGNSGQLAMLHEKELVLNANDTRNMLSAMEILREITLGSSIFSRLAAVGANASIVNGGFGDTLEQNVHIDASFPNVTNSHEIEDAINNLMNVATQRINRR